MRDKVSGYPLKTLTLLDPANDMDGMTHPRSGHSHN